MIEINWDEFKVRCSAISSVLSDSRSNPVLTDKQEQTLAIYRKHLEDGVILPKKRLDDYKFLLQKEANGSKVVLSDTCIQYLMEEYAWITEGMIPVGKEALDLAAVRKGNLVEGESAILLTRVDKLPYKAHKERIYSNYLSGQIDLYLGESVMEAEDITDLKNSEDYPTFLKKIHTKIDPSHDWQIKGYMDITGAGTGKVAHTLVDTPDEIIEGLKYKLAMRMNALTIESPEFLAEWDKWERSMKFNRIPLHKRVHKIKVEPMGKFEKQKLYDRVKICRQWLSDFHEEHEKRNL